ncbi:ethanolamine ammonia-lyase subunit EutC [Streptomyces sp. NPDC057682]|uniref:ethanolamine ammonia-lyase subunit EutC n=1 Tax=Streptomyces sp. NPDC057682 TaxID=3346210 RepID=UPI0036A456A6
MDGEVPPELWEPLRRRTPARIGLGRTGAGLPVGRLLEFQAAHALARDAVHTPVDFSALRAGLTGHRVVEVRSAAPDRATYLRRPDLGRRVRPDDAGLLSGVRADELVFVVADGLSATAVGAHALPLLKELRPLLGPLGTAPVVLASQARVALGDEVGERTGARLVVVLIGERPGLSAADSLGVYVTYGPRVGRRDSERTCLSNIHPPGGLGHRAAAVALANLVERALRQGATGLALGDAALGPASGDGA